MLGQLNDVQRPPSSPTVSSISSSDLDTESTGSFFHDRSTTLGTLMGVNFPAITFRASSQSRNLQSATDAAVLGAGRRNNRSRRSRSAAAEADPRRRWQRQRHRRRWCGLCWDQCSPTPASLGEFLEVERRFGDIYGGGAVVELEGIVNEGQGNGRVLFADGRVLPPPESPAASPGLCRFSVGSLTGLCSGGV